MPNSVKSQEERYPISPCTESDIHQMFSVYYSAFSTSPIHALLFPPTVTLSSIETWFCNKTAEQMKRPDIRFFKITDARTGYIVAFVRLGYPQNSTVIVDVQSQLGDDVTDGTDTVKTQKFDAEDMPAGTNGTFGQAKFGPLKTWRDKYIDYEEDYGQCYAFLRHSNLSGSCLGSCVSSRNTPYTAEERIRKQVVENDDRPSRW